MKKFVSDWRRDSRCRRKKTLPSQSELSSDQWAAFCTSSLRTITLIVCCPHRFSIRLKAGLWLGLQSEENLLVGWNQMNLQPQTKPPPAGWGNISGSGSGPTGSRTSCQTVRTSSSPATQPVAQTGCVTHLLPWKRRLKREVMKSLQKITQTKWASVCIGEPPLALRCVCACFHLSEPLTHFLTEVPKDQTTPPQHSKEWAGPLEVTWSPECD